MLYQTGICVFYTNIYHKATIDIFTYKNCTQPEELLEQACTMFDVFILQVNPELENGNLSKSLVMIMAFASQLTVEEKMLDSYIDAYCSLKISFNVLMSTHFEKTL